jgi:hypothetical protein
MADLVFPQLTSGALAQFPIRKQKFARTVKNMLQDGTLILYPDPNGNRIVWELMYLELSVVDAQALQSHFQNCAGPFKAFTFIDPTENMLSYSADLTASAWQCASGLKLAAGDSDPAGGTGAFTLANAAQATVAISQTLAVPSGFQFCFSVYVCSAQRTTVTLNRTGPQNNALSTYDVGPAWTRLTSSGRLSDPGTTLSVGISVGAGQQIQVFGPQLEAQVEPSRYRPTAAQGGVYANAHWAVDQLPLIAEAPNLFSTSFSIESMA